MKIIDYYSARQAREKVVSRFELLEVLETTNLRYLPYYILILEVFVAKFSDTTILI